MANRTPIADSTAAAPLAPATGAADPSAQVRPQSPLESQPQAFSPNSELPLDLTALSLAQLMDVPLGGGRPADPFEALDRGGVHRLGRLSRSTTLAPALAPPTNDALPLDLTLVSLPQLMNLPLRAWPLAEPEPEEDKADALAARGPETGETPAQDEAQQPGESSPAIPAPGGGGFEDFAEALAESDGTGEAGGPDGLPSLFALAAQSEGESDGTDQPVPENESFGGFGPEPLESSSLLLVAAAGPTLGPAADPTPAGPTPASPAVDPTPAGPTPDPAPVAELDLTGGSASATVTIPIGNASATVTVPVGNAIEGGAGDDTLVGTNQADVIFGYDGNDLIDGGNSGDTLYGGAGDDILIGGNGADVLDGGSGADQLFGGAGGDILIWDAADSVIDGGRGADTLRAQNGDDLDLTAFGGTLSNIETIDLASDPGSNSLTLTAQDVLDMTDGGNDLTVLLGIGDVLNANAGPGTWTQVGSGGGIETYSQTIGADVVSLVVEHDPTAVLNVAF